MTDRRRREVESSRRLPDVPLFQHDLEQCQRVKADAVTLLCGQYWM
ncbi:hypothetical protein [Sinorhizobium medicae]|nr:hypothetical protein [Sinorhizobium medicae]